MFHFSTSSGAVIRFELIRAVSSWWRVGDNVRHCAVDNSSQMTPARHILYMLIERRRNLLIFPSSLPHTGTEHGNSGALVVFPNFLETPSTIHEKNNEQNDDFIIRLQTKANENTLSTVPQHALTGFSDSTIWLPIVNSAIHNRAIR